MACPFVMKCGRYQVYATTQTTGVQYYKICDKLCNLYKKPSILADIVSTGAQASDSAVLTASCGGIIPLYAASTLSALTVKELPAGTSIEVVVKTVNSIPQGIVLGV